MAVYCITGAAGFIGSALARSLVDRGDVVRGIDNLTTGTLDNLRGYEKYIDLHLADVTDLSSVRKAVECSEFVLHQAAIASVPRSIADPLTTHDTNVNGTLNVLIAARDAGVRRVVFAASSSAYGDLPEQPKTESMPASPLSPYAAQKLAGEYYMQAFWRSYGLPTVCLRYFNIFGPHQGADSPYSGVIAKFIDAMQHGRAPRICGDGNQSRDFTYVSNAVAANILACEAPMDNVCGRVFNIGTGHSHSLNETYALLAQLFKLGIKPVYEAERNGDIRHSQASIQLARRYLGYTPVADFEDELRDTVEWYRGDDQGKPTGQLSAV